MVKGEQLERERQDGQPGRDGDDAEREMTGAEVTDAVSVEHRMVGSPGAGMAEGAAGVVPAAPSSVVLRRVRR